MLTSLCKVKIWDLSSNRIQETRFSLLETYQLDVAGSQGCCPLQNSNSSMYLHTA